MAWLSALLLACAPLAAIWLRNRTLPSRDRPWVAAAIALPLAVAPFLLPETALLPRAVATALAVSVAMKIRMLLDAEEVDPAMTAHIPRFLLWLLIPAATRFPRNVVFARAARQGGLRRLIRASMKAPFMVTMIVLRDRFPHIPWPVASLLTSIEFYLMLSGLADALGGLVMLFGIHVDEAFGAPLLARSPADFWGRRWNLFVTRFAHRHVFFSLARRRQRLAGLLAVFVCSGLMHEYVVAACLGFGRYIPGPMLLFFVVQAPAVLVAHWRERKRKGVRRLPTALAVAANISWMVLTAPLFFWPLQPIVAAFDSTWLRLLGLR